ncbi:MAG: hypothetical protein N2544_10505 [Burkholderiales bacterium]|nr:hypothetical protein [Burkholderiales bacterium]
MRSSAMHGGAAAGALALAAVALAAALTAALPLVDLLPCMKLWQHGVAACLP